MNKKVVVGVITGLVVISLLVAMAVDPSRDGNNLAGERIGVIYVEGVITGARDDAGLFLQGAGGSTVMEQIREAAEDDTIKAVLLRINSPGGSAAASQEIGDELDKLRKKGKVVVASMGEVAASGGYWIAAKADRIVADPATMTGSIGVIMETADMQELFKKVGVSPQTVKSGPFKDIGSPNRPMTEEERRILQGMVDDIYQQFVDVVAKGRKMDRGTVLKLADGRIFTGRQAKEKGLVDELGNFYHAVDVVKKLAKIEGEPELYEFGPRNTWEKLFGQAGTMLGIDGSASGLTSRELQLLRGILRTQPIIEQR